MAGLVDVNVNLENGSTSSRSSPNFVETVSIMESKVTRLSFDTQLYTVTAGNGSRMVKANDLRQWLVGLRVLDSAIHTLFAIAPDETIALQVVATLWTG